MFYSFFLTLLFVKPRTFYEKLIVTYKKNYASRETSRFFSKNGFIKNSVEQSQKERGAM